jgi:hypothetical protein
MRLRNSLTNSRKYFQNCSLVLLPNCLPSRFLNRSLIHNPIRSQASPIHQLNRSLTHCRILALILPHYQWNWMSRMEWRKDVRLAWARLEKWSSQNANVR